MDEREPIEQGAGPADAEAQADQPVSYEDSEKRLLELAFKYRGKTQLGPHDVEDGEKEEFTTGWRNQHERWEQPYDDYVAIVNDINQYLSIRYKGVPDLMVASACMAAAQHLMGLVTAEQVEHQRARNGATSLKDLAQRLGLAVSDAGGHG